MIPAFPRGSGWPGAGILAALIALAPLGGGGSSSTSILVLHTLAAVAACWTWFAVTDPGRPAPGFLAAAAFAVWCLMGTLRASYGYGSFGETWDVLVYLAVFWAAWRMPAGPAVHRLFYRIVLASAVFQAALALHEGIVRWGFRAAGTFVNPNHTSAYLNLFLGMAAARLVAARGRARWTALAVAVVLAAQIWPISSRGGLAALVLVHGAAMILWATTRRARWATAGLVALLVVGVGVAVAWRFSGPEDVYRHARLEFWRASVSAAAEDPLAGKGPGMFEHLAERYNFPRTEGPVRYGRTFRSAHSQYLQVLVETGIIGLALFLLAAGSLLAALARGSRRGGDGGRRAGVLLGLAALAVHGLVEPVLSSPGIALTAAILAGGALRRERPPAEGRHPAPRSARLVLPALGIVSGLYYAAIVAPWLADRHYRRLIVASDLSSLREELRGALSHNPFQPYYYDHAARRLLDSTDRLDPASYAICYDYASKAVLLHPADPWLHVSLARVNRRGSTEVFHDRVGLQKALHQYRLAVERAPTDPRPSVEMAGLLLEMGQAAPALEAAERALEMEPNFFDAHRVKILALRRLLRESAEGRARRDLEARIQAVEGYRPQNDYEAVILTRRFEGASGD